MISRYCRFPVLCGLLLAGLAVAVPQLRAQYSSPPQSYSVTEINSMFAQGEIMKVYRDSSKAVIELSVPPQGADSKGVHTRSFYDLQAHTNSTVNLNYANAGCSTGTFSGDWGDPFAGSAQMAAELASKNPAQLGAETVNGFPTKVVEVSAQGAKMKLWIDQKYGLIVKYVLTKPDGTESTVLEMKELSTAKPPASMFVVPAACAQAEADAAERALKPEHQVTSVRIDDPPPYTGGCPAKMHFTGTITTDGPGTVWFKITAGVTGKEGEGEVKFTAAGTKSVSKDLLVSSSPGAGGGSALLQAAMENAHGRHGDSTANANNRFEYNCK